MDYSISDDQSLVPEDLRHIADPSPKLDFNQIKQNNKNHKVIVSVIDSGIDYNHPRLAHNIHYQLSETGILGFGYDLLGKDTWASPYLIHTARFSTDKDQDYVDMTQALRKNKTEFFDLFFKESSYGPERFYLLEQKMGVGHGTHVADIISRSDKNIGIIGFRALPFLENWQKDKLSLLLFKPTKINKSMDYIIDSIERSIELGANVINLSLSMFLEKGTKAYDLYSHYMDKYRTLMQANPDVAFVIASGNDGRWSDGKSQIHMPCSISDVENMICVGAIDNDLDIAPFSNIPFNVEHFVLAPGKDIEAAIPSLSCDLAVGGYDKNKVSDFLIQMMAFTDCSKNLDKTGKKSGTSMATPFVSRLIAKKMIEYGAGNKSASRIIKKILKRSKKIKINNNKFKVVIDPELLNKENN